MVFVLVPLVVFLVLQWLNRRKDAARSPTGEDMAASLERRRRLAGGLIPERPGSDKGSSEAQPSREEEGS